MHGVQLQQREVRSVHRAAAAASQNRNEVGEKKRWGLIDRALSLILSYSTGRVPVQCSIRVPADSTEEQIKEALNELDRSFNLGECLTVFVLPPEGCYLGKPAHEQYLRSAVIHKIEKDQVYKLLIKGPNGLPLTGKVTEIYTDFRFRVACSDSQVRQMMITEFADRDQYMLRPGDYVYVER